MIGQNENGLYPSIQTYGSLYLCLLCTKRKDWTVEQVNGLFNDLVAEGILSGSCSVNDWGALLKYIKSPFEWLEREDSLEGDNSLIVERWVTNTPFNHYTLRGNDFRYDPAGLSFRCKYVDRYDLLGKKETE